MATVKPSDAEYRVYVRHKDGGIFYASSDNDLEVLKGEVEIAMNRVAQRDPKAVRSMTVAFYRRTNV